MFRRMIAIVILASLLAVAGPALAIPGAVDDLADPRPSPAVSFTDAQAELSEPKPIQVIFK